MNSERYIETLRSLKKRITKKEAETDEGWTIGFLEVYK
jgi:hypothetical protein